MKTILVAEDNESNYILMTYILKKDYQIVRAANGQEAVDKVEAGGIDLILMDIKMPVMDGLEATRIIRAKHPDLPIIALTANAFDSDRDSALQAGCNEFITKPVNRQTTLDTIAKYI
jgi:two-component system cell cycle response regulator DivK